MFRLKFFTSLFLTATMITACGESFRSHLNGELTDFGNNDLHRNIWTNDPSSGDIDPDKNILFDYQEELEGRENRTLLLGRKIKAFDIVLSKASSSEINLSARITFDCDNLIDYRATASKSDLSSMEVVDLGTKEDYNLKVECTVSDCNQMVVAIRQRSVGENATVLVGLIVDRKVDEELIYTSRNVAYTPYFKTFHGYGHYSRANNCQPNDTNNGNSLTGLLTRFLETDTGKNLVDKAKDFLKDLF